MEFAESDDSVAVENRIEPPRNYKVVLLNDDYTTMDFVVYVLTHIFQKNETDATAIMKAVHKSGRGIAGIYSYDIAASRVRQTISLARANEFPLNCVLEEE